MGFTFFSEAMSATPNNAQLQPSIKLAPSCDDGKSNNIAPDRIIPITTGRIKAIVLFIYRLSFSRRKNFVISIISVSAGRHTDIVATTEPQKPATV